MKTLKIGIVIADDMEYAPIAALGGREERFFFRDGHAFTFEGKDRRIELHTLCCGIGKVNAATAAMYLIDNGCEMLFNTGLSGGISGIARGALMLCTRCLEYDFDLSPLGYDKAVKPSQEYIYEADGKLLNFFSRCYPSALLGTAVTGDRFVSDETLRLELAQRFDAMSCDMESAAVASVCHMAGVPFLSLRRVSDDAGEDAGVAYRDMNENEKFDLAVLLYNAVAKMLRDDTFFS